MSLIEKRDVMEVIREKFPATLELVLAAMILALIFSDPPGGHGGHEPGGLVGPLQPPPGPFRGLLPPFLVRADVPAHLRVSPGPDPFDREDRGESAPDITGFFLLDSLLSLNGTAFQDSLAHIIGPAMILSLGPWPTSPA